MSNTQKNETIAVVSPSTEQLSNLVMDVLAQLSPRQKVALSSRWAMLKQAERDTLAAYEADGWDSAGLYAIYSLQSDADAKIFSDNRAKYVATLMQWHTSLISSEESIRKYATTEIATVAGETTASQQLALLSAVKAQLLKGKTFMPEAVEKAFRALCRSFGYDISAVK